jgi:oxygen-independent coproporphyrinogen-3 oxidase
MEYQVRVGKLAKPDDDLAADMYDLAEKILGEKNYEQYEISNWAQPGHSSNHNLVYWKNGSYVGVGPGAHSSLNNHRFSNLNSPRQYISKLNSTKTHTYQPWEKLNKEKLHNLPFIDDIEVLEKSIQMGETMMLGLRLNEGIYLDSFSQRFGQDLRRVYKEEVEDLTNLGLLHCDEKSLKLTDEGRLLGNEVFARFL